MSDLGLGQTSPYAHVNATYFWMRSLNTTPLYNVTMTFYTGVVATSPNRNATVTSCYEFFYTVLVTATTLEVPTPHKQKENVTKIDFLWRNCDVVCLARNTSSGRCS